MLEEAFFSSDCIRNGTIKDLSRGEKGWGEGLLYTVYLSWFHGLCPILHTFSDLLNCIVACIEDHHLRQAQEGTRDLEPAVVPHIGNVHRDKLGGLSIKV